MKFPRNVMIAAAASALALFLAGCQKEGAGEKAGKAVDQAVEKAGQQMEKAGKAVDKAADKAGEQIEKAREEVRDAAKGDKK